TFERIRVASPNLLRSADPPLEAAYGHAVQGVHRMGKRIVVDLDGDLHLVLHLMVAGRLRWLRSGAKVPRRVGLAALDFSAGTLLVTEASPRQRGSLHLVQGDAALGALDPAGLEVMTCSAGDFRAALRREDHTLKRTLTDPHIVSGIGNA